MVVDSTCMHWLYNNIWVYSKQPGWNSNFSCYTTTVIIPNNARILRALLETVMK